MGTKKKGEILLRSIGWQRNGEPSSKLYLVSVWTEKEKSINLLYSIHDTKTGQKYKFDHTARHSS